MATFTTGADWGFPDDLPGGWVKLEGADGSETGDAEIKQEDAPTPPTDDQYSPPQSEDPQPNQQQRRRRHYPPRQCRICLEVVQPTFVEPSASLPSLIQSAPQVIYTSPVGEGGRLVRPCKCKGSQQYVHADCLSLWRMQDPLRQRNFFECPTCGYTYRLQRLAWAQWISSTIAQVSLTVCIFIFSMFALGFVADPIINLYLDPYTTVMTAGGPTGSLMYDGEPASWTEHFVKGLASLGLLGFAKFLLTLSPWHWLNMRGTGGTVYMDGSGRRRMQTGTGQDRLSQLGWITIVIGIATFLYAVWTGVRAWSRRILEKAGERVMDVDGEVDDCNDDETEQDDTHAQ